MLIDLNSQSSLTISVGLKPSEAERAIVDVLRKDGTPIRECIQQISDRLHIVKLHHRLSLMEMVFRASREKILNQVLKPAWEEYDCNLIDYPPQLSILTINTLSCVDEVDQPLSAAEPT